MKQVILSLAILISSLAFSQSSVSPPQVESAADYELFMSNSSRSATTEVTQVTQGSMFTLDQVQLSALRSAAPSSVSLEIPMSHGEDLFIDLYEVDIFSEDFLLTVNGDQEVTDVDLGLHYRGTVAGEKNSVVALSVYGEELRGVIVKGSDNYTLGPVSLGSSEYICYRSEDLTDEIKDQLNFGCASTESGSDVYSPDELEFSQKLLGDVVEIYVEVDNTIYVTQGSSLTAASNYTISVFNQCAAIYGQEGIGIVTSQINIWSSTDPYDGVNACSSDVRDEYLCDFQAQFGGFNGDLAILLIDENIGGVAAGFSGICNANPDNSMCISGQSGTVVNDFPTYSYNTYIFAHELGHLFGSRHTHACVWNGNNTAIDGCSATEGGCALPPVPASGDATIMSYCQTQLAGGYIATAPFGTQPGNVIRASVAGAACLGCASPTIYIPLEVSTGPAVYLCPGDDIPDGYIIAGSQSCAQSVIDDDPFCLGANGGVWDGICNNAYETCLDDCVIWLPNATTAGPAVYVCPGESAPTGYVIAGFQDCAQTVIDTDPYCLQTSWDNVCVNQYLACIGGCPTVSFTVWLPEIGVSGPAEIVCSGGDAPAGYFLAGNQACARQIIENDQYCITNFWDTACRNAYEACHPPTCEDGIQNGDEEGVDCGGAECPTCPCPGASFVYLPDSLTSGPAVIVCSGDPAPSGYVFAASQACAFAVVENDPFCLENNWDSFCQNAYDACRGEGCTGATTIYLPDEGTSGPAIQGCGLTPAGYSAAVSQECAQFVIDDDPYCANTTWDGICAGSYDACEPCEVYLNAPVDLTKSFDPVGGVQDRVQVKWYKASPQVKYTDADAAMCDIKFWAKRTLDPVTGNPIGPVIVNPDTVLLEDRVKTYGDGSPRSIFKWPIKFRADGVNNNTRVDPNIRYEWQVRCECGHSGTGLESPWSDVKIFNTPDFDPSTGIYTPGTSAWSDNEIKSLATPIDFQLYPNPTSGESLFIQLNDEVESSMLIRIYNMHGQLIYDEQVQAQKGGNVVELTFERLLSQGLYTLELTQDGQRNVERFMVK